MPRRCRRDSIFRDRRYEDDIVVLCVRWYISYRLSLRDLTEIRVSRRPSSPSNARSFPTPQRRASFPIKNIR